MMSSTRIATADHKSTFVVHRMILPAALLTDP
jgi:hypothetical protein